MIKIALITIAVGALIKHLFPFIQVTGDSMFPTYLDGEIIICTRLFRKSKIKSGDVIVYHSPTDKKVVIKRVFEVAGSKRDRRFYCLGDNAEISYDSRYYGYVHSKSLLCKAIKSRPKEEM